METLNYKVLEGTGYNGYILKDAPVKVMQFGEGNFLRAFVDYFYVLENLSLFQLYTCTFSVILKVRQTCPCRRASRCTQGLTDF